MDHDKGLSGMDAGHENRAALWVDGRLTVRLRGLGHEPGRIIRLRQPYALIGQIPGADIRIDDPDVDGRHALLLLDRRGVFGVDLRSRTGTRFAGGAADSAWIGPGDILEVAGRRIELLEVRIDGTAVNPPLSDDNPLGDAPGLVGLTLEPIDFEGPPWMLGSALAFIGRGDACAIRINHVSASMTHCALLRSINSAYMIDLFGRRTLLNDRPVEGASALADGDILTIGQARFTVRLDVSARSTLPATRDAGRGLADDPRGAVVALLVEALGASQDDSTKEIMNTLRQFRADMAGLLESQINRIDTLNREVASLREELQGQLGPLPEPAEPLQLNLKTSPSGPPGESASWLLNRLDDLEAQGRSERKGLLARIASAVTPGPPAQPSRSLQPIRRRDD
jgi:pSer/pThr/pTyr-binding forkhead associated (FHA) protein